MQYGWGCIAAIVIAACSTFDSTSSTPADGGTTAGDAGSAGDGSRYDPNGTIPCDNEICHPPTYCCQRQNGASTCETVNCTGSDVARQRCNGSSSCTAGNVCCMRLANYRIESIECEPTCPPVHAATGSFQVCGDGDANGVCPGACVSVTTVLGGNKPFPTIDVRVCE